MMCYAERAKYGVNSQRGEIASFFAYRICARPASRAAGHQTHDFSSGHAQVFQRDPALDTGPAAGGQAQENTKHRISPAARQARRAPPLALSTRYSLLLSGSGRLKLGMTRCDAAALG